MFHLGPMTRSPEITLQYLPNAEVFLEESDYFGSGKNKIVIIKYKYTPVNHLPGNVAQIIPLLQQLRQLDHDGIVHADIRASNIIFSDQRSLFIDFDLSGKEGIYLAIYI
jgi:predicted Ser/Thr protein kinase